MKERLHLTQDTLAYMYEQAQKRMKCHPDVAAKFKKRLEAYPFYKSEEDALEAAYAKKDAEFYQIWAKIGRDEEYYYLEDYFISTDENLILQAAEYVGMAQIY